MLSTVAAIAFLAAVLALPLAAVIVGVMRSRLNPLECTLWGLAYLLARLLWRASWSGPLPVPTGRGAIIVCNHRSSVDPFFIQTTTGRPVHWMVASEFFRKPGFGWFLRTCQAVPVNRGGSDTGATKTAIRIAAQGGLVGMFPEGRINMTEELMLPGRPGAALIALKARALLVPCYIEGSPFDSTAWGPLLMPARVHVSFGEPLDLDQFYGREGEAGVTEEVMRRCLAAIARLAGRPDYQPRLAGRAWKPTAEGITAHLAARSQRRRTRVGR